MIEMTIYKYPLEPGATTVELSFEHRILKAGIDPATGNPAVWVLVDPTSKTRITRQFYIEGTGFPRWDHEDMIYVDTVFQGSFVWHVWVDNA